MNFSFNQWRDADGLATAACYTWFQVLTTAKILSGVGLSWAAVYNRRTLKMNANCDQTVICWWSFWEYCRKGWQHLLLLADSIGPTGAGKAEKGRGQNVQGRGGCSINGTLDPIPFFKPSCPLPLDMDQLKTWCNSEKTHCGVVGLWKGVGI